MFLLVAAGSAAQSPSQPILGGVQQNEGTIPADVFASGAFDPSQGVPDPRNARPVLGPQGPRPCYPGACDEKPPKLPVTGYFNLASLPPQERTCVEKYYVQLNADLQALTPLYLRLYHTYDQTQYLNISRQVADGWQQAFRRYEESSQRYCLPENSPAALPPYVANSTPMPQPAPQPVLPINTPEKPFACQAAWNNWLPPAISACRNDRGCAERAYATAQEGVKACGTQPPPCADCSCSQPVASLPSLFERIGQWLIPAAEAANSPPFLPPGTWTIRHETRTNQGGNTLGVKGLPIVGSAIVTTPASKSRKLVIQYNPGYNGVSGTITLTYVGDVPWNNATARDFSYAPPASSVSPGSLLPSARKHVYVQLLSSGPDGTCLQDYNFVWIKQPAQQNQQAVVDREESFDNFPNASNQ
jgi:hypothetical protein